MGTIWPAPPAVSSDSTPPKRLTAKESSGNSVRDKSASPLPDKTEPDRKESAIFMVNIETNGFPEDEASERASQGTASEETSRTDPEAISRRKKSSRGSIKKRVEKCRVS